MVHIFYSKKELLKVLKKKLSIKSEDEKKGRQVPSRQNRRTEIPKI
jgi:hypothetical protein